MNHHQPLSLTSCWKLSEGKTARLTDVAICIIIPTYYCSQWHTNDEAPMSEIWYTPAVLNTQLEPSHVHNGAWWGFIAAGFSKREPMTQGPQIVIWTWLDGKHDTSCHNISSDFDLFLNNRTHTVRGARFIQGRRSSAKSLSGTLGWFGFFTAAEPSGVPPIAVSPLTSGDESSCKLVNQVIITLK